MNRFSDFINEEVTDTVKKEQEPYVTRLKNLVNIILPLLKEAIELHPNVKKYKRCTALTNKLNELIYKVNKKKEEPLYNSSIVGFKGELKIGQEYIYTPDIYTRQEYSNLYAGRIVELIKIQNSHYNPGYCDSRYKCDHLIKVFIPHSGYITFWTRKECLKKMR